MKRLTIIFLAAMMFAACNTGVNPTKETTSADASAKVYDCDVTPDDMVASAKIIQEDNNSILQDYISAYIECVGENRLRIRCQEVINCAGNLQATSIVKDNVITLMHSDIENGPQANCICQHWIDHEFTDLPYGKYEIICTYLYVTPTIYTDPEVRWRCEFDFNAQTEIKVYKED